MSSRKRYVVLTPFAQADTLAGILKLRAIEAAVVLTDSGACVVHEIPADELDPWDLSSILGPDTAAESPAADAAEDESNPDYVARVLSKLSKFGVVLLSADLGDDVGLEPGVSGLVQARRYMNGAPDEELPAGLVLNSVDQKVEDLILGLSPIEEIGATIKTADVTPTVLQRMFGRRRKPENSAPEQAPIVDEAAPAPSDAESDQQKDSE